MAESFSLKDQLFNEETVGQLAAEYAQALPEFDAATFQAKALGGFTERGLLERLDWLADCIEPYLASDFPIMAEQIEAAMPPPLNPDLRDDDFGHFIHAIPGILAVRHGLEHHRSRALDLLHRATQRFSMEFYIRPFLNHAPKDTLARLHDWAEDSNYHVRRLVSEGTRPKLPWAKAVSLTSEQTVPLLNKLHGDSTRFVTRSVANHLNDIAKSEPDRVLDCFAAWRKAGAQAPKELDWMRRHALRTLIKQGHPGAMSALGYARDLELVAELNIATPKAKIGAALEFSGKIVTTQDAPVLVDYVLWLTKADGNQTPKVFKLKTGKARAGTPFLVNKTHKLKGDATTFRLYPGPARLGLQVNGRVVADAPFELFS